MKTVLDLTKIEFTPYCDAFDFTLTDALLDSDGEEYYAGIDIPCKEDPEWHFWLKFEYDNVAWDLADEEKEYIKKKAVSYCASNGYVFNGKYFEIKDNVVSHPSYATMVFNRSTGGKTALFGSSIEHRDTISLEIYHAEHKREYHSDSYYGDKLMLRAKMSYSQFAEAITSFGMGTGVPITLQFTEKDGKIPPCTFTPKREQFLKEFQEKREEATKDAENLIDEVMNLFQKKSLTKGDRTEILSKLQMLNNEIGRNMDFVGKMFNEQMDITVREAKGEVEAFCQNKVQQLASGALIEHRDELEALDEPVTIDEL